MEIWSSQLGVAIEAMAMVNVPADDIEAIGITNQRETTIIWDKRLENLYTMRLCGSAEEQLIRLKK